MYTVEKKENVNNTNLAFNVFFALMFLIGVVTTLSLITMGLVYIGG